MILPTSPDVCLHFGCIGRSGHYANHPDGERANPNPWGKWMSGMDGKLHSEDHDRWLTHWFEASDGSKMTFIAKKDNSVDSRPGSWCGFLMPEHRELEYALKIAQGAWPQLLVWK